MTLYSLLNQLEDVRDNIDRLLRDDVGGDDHPQATHQPRHPSVPQPSAAATTHCPLCGSEDFDLSQLTAACGNCGWDSPDTPSIFEAYQHGVTSTMEFEKTLDYVNGVTTGFVPEEKPQPDAYSDARDPGFYIEGNHVSGKSLFTPCPHTTIRRHRNRDDRYKCTECHKLFRGNVFEGYIESLPEDTYRYVQSEDGVWHYYYRQDAVYSGCPHLTIKALHTYPNTEMEDPGYHHKCATCTQLFTNKELLDFIQSRNAIQDVTGAGYRHDHEHSLWQWYDSSGEAVYDESD